MNERNNTTYGIINDLHLHNWSAFSHVNVIGFNNRLTQILNEIKRAAEEVKECGGDTLYIAGDIFHVQGKITPSVLNPTTDFFRQIVEEMKMNVPAIPENHDLENRDSDGLGNAIRALEGAGVDVCDEITVFSEDSNKVVMVPWYSSIADLKEAIKRIGDTINPSH